MEKNQYTYKGINIYHGMRIKLRNNINVILNTEDYNRRSFFYFCGDDNTLNGGHRVERFGKQFAWAFNPHIKRGSKEIKEFPRIDTKSLLNLQEIGKPLYEIY